MATARANVCVCGCLAQNADIEKLPADVCLALIFVSGFPVKAVAKLRNLFCVVSVRMQ